jgi:hypothetical protein
MKIQYSIFASLFQVFGPLLPIVPVRDHKEAINIINDRLARFSIVSFMLLPPFGYLLHIFAHLWFTVKPVK